MNSKELSELTKQRVQEVRRKRIWQKAYKIVEVFGKKEVRVSSDHTTCSYDLNVIIGDSVLSVHKCNYVYGGDYIYIDTREGRVFDASETDKYDLNRDPKKLPRAFCLKRGKDSASKWILVAGYFPGDWEKLLNLRLIKKTLDANKRAERERTKKVSEEAVHKQPLSDQEKELAKSFGVKC